MTYSVVIYREIPTRASNLSTIFSKLLSKFLLTRRLVLWIVSYLSPLRKVDHKAGTYRIIGFWT
jgi:hypothetical protein